MGQTDPERSSADWAGKTPMIASKLSEKYQDQGGWVDQESNVAFVWIGWQSVYVEKPAEALQANCMEEEMLKVFGAGVFLRLSTDAS